MLQHLYIQNYALIENLEMHFSKGFVTITGETGAGKSIILGALGLLLGERANLVAIKNKDKKCIVEGAFAIKTYGLESFFEKNDIDYEEITLIRRELTPQGKSRAFINDTPITLNTLKELSQKLLDIHSQHQNLEIEKENFQFQLVDSLAQNKKEKAKYNLDFETLKKLENQKHELLENQKTQNTDIDYWTFQFKELQTANLKEDEQEALEEENSLFSKIEQIQLTLAGANDFFQSENSPIDFLHKLTTDFAKIREVHAPSKEFEERLKSCLIELKDIAEEISSENDCLQNDPKRQSYVSERLDTIYRLQQKHNKESIKELLALQDELDEKLSKLSNFDAQIAKLETKIDKQKEQTEKSANELSKTRKKVIPTLEKKISNQLKELGMPNTKIVLELKKAENFREQGKEHLSILFSANKNSPLSNISTVASGGELSRVMLTIKQIMAQSLVLPTLIFDEIDTGVSGEIADKMGKMMQEMAKNLQVIVITHLPQITAKAVQHFQVYKEDTNIQTRTDVKELTENEHIEAIAKMLSGKELTKEALANAKVFLNAK